MNLRMLRSRLPQLLVAAVLPWAGRAPAAALASLSPRRLQCEYLDNPLGIDSTVPRLSWVVVSPHRAQKQTAYQILVASSEAELKADRGDLWDTGKVTTDQTLQVAYSGQALKSSQRCFWKVRVWDQ